MCSDYLFQALLNCFFYDSNIDKTRKYKTYQTRQQILSRTLFLS